MKTMSPMTFTSLHFRSDFVESDKSALATQIGLCRTDQSVWSSLCAQAERIQAFTAQHVLSTLVLLGIGAYSTYWLIG